MADNNRRRHGRKSSSSSSPIRSCFNDDLALNPTTFARSVDFTTELIVICT
ncbi:hypothetical protein HanRHA438_Chr01g0003791 [Helianthus annuus]|nr:hypothetical protein HanRHA438_Chr01g0003791 [Helianthus annuus]KAJ0955482.1 hypothetical protein HanPSC8_Chr01g0003381 [Helianthus annuus]